jgi:hypothetical protein
MFTIGQIVLFGTPNGERTKGEIIKINRVALKIKQLEQRNSKPAGTIWRVPQSLVYSLDAPDQPIAPKEAHNVHTDVSSNEMPSLMWILQHEHELYLMGAVYSNLSPENLSCDGECSPTEVRRRRAFNETRLKLITNLLGRTMDEDTCYECCRILNERKMAAH